MDKTNSKILTLSFAIGAAIIAFTLSMLIKILAGAFNIFAQVFQSEAVRHGVPVAVGLGIFFFCQFNPRILAWGEEVITEVRKVVFPSRKDVTAMTIVVVIMVLISSGIITTFDFVSAQAMNLMLK